MSSDEKEQKRITRREFVKGAAVGAAGVAAAGVLAGCTTGTPEVITKEVVVTKEVPVTVEVIKEVEVKPWLPEKWDRETDVVVVGTGVGQAAAIAAKEAGAGDVLVLERNDWVGGLWIAAGGSFTMGGNNVVQQRAGVVDDDETWYQDEMYANDYRGQPEIMRALIARGPDTVEWMEDLGMVWDTVQNGVLYGRTPIQRGIRPAQSPNYAGGSGTPNSGICWIQVWENKLNELGVPILLNHRMRSIYREPNGTVLGVEVDTPEGTINIKGRKAVVLCTGTWTDNYRMAQAWDPRIVGPGCYGDGGIPSKGKLLVDSAGDGHLAAAEIGAGFSDMSFVSYIYIFYGARSYWGWGEEPIDWTTNDNYASGKGLNKGNAAMFERIILVKNDGARWINETYPPSAPGAGGLSEWPEWSYPATYLSLPQPRNVWCITDAEGVAALEWPEDEMRNPNPETGRMFDPALLAIADTLEELAAKMDIPADALQETVNRYNGFVDAGVDEDFGKPMPMYKIQTPPFFAAKASLIRHTQRNGLRVNTKSQVIDQTDQRDGYSGVSEDGSVSIDAEKVIPRLYAAGELGNVLGWRRPHNSLGHYTTAARWAGENAAKETPLA